MFKTLMALCLINGEIILASLLFGVLVRDWQKRVQLGQLNEDEATDEAQTLPVKSTVIYDTPFPAWSHLNNMCEYIRESTSTLPDTDPESFMRHTNSIQALANLAHLLDRRMLPIGGLTDLVQTMYKSPSTHLNVWVWARNQKNAQDGRRDHPMQVEAHAYFKNVLERLALRLPKPLKGASNSSPPRESAPAPLTLQTYNTLLHYSLAHARSRPMADKILHHLVHIRQDMQPSVVTMNVLDKAAMRSRGVNGINRQWVERWKQQIGECPKNQSSDRKRRRSLELLDIADRYDRNSNNNYTLSTRIADLIASGRPEVVVDALPALLPRERDRAIRRAVAYGPVVLTSILTALMKTGHTGLAEKVWGITKEAERLSWVMPLDNGGEKVLSPWCLGVEAYTVMLKMYGKEARKGAGYGHDRSRFDQGVDTGNNMVVGWGPQKKRGKRGGRRIRHRLGRRMGMNIYRAALKEAAITRGKFDQLSQHDGSLQIRIVKNQLRLPQPDAPFFNAILDIVGRRPGMKPRSRASCTRRRARSRLVLKRRKYVWEGRVIGMIEPDRRLREVARDMRRYGFQVPLLVRRLLVGRDEDIEGAESGQEGRVWLSSKSK
jgi:hypothetical protein